MTQHVLLVLRDGEPPRCVGPFALKRSAESLVELEQLREGEYLIQPLEPPTARHRLIPSPVPRDARCAACGKPFLPTHSIAAPGPTSRHPFRRAVGDVVIADSEDLSPEVQELATRLLQERRDQLGERGVRALYETTPRTLSPEGQAVVAGALADWEEKKRQAGADPVNFTARHPYRDLAAGGRPITQWIEAHADQLRRFAPTELPDPPKEIEP